MICRAPPMRAPWTIDSPTPPQPNTATVWPGLEPRAPQRRADAGEDAAAHERGAVERQVGVDLHHRVLVQQHALGVAADAGELPERPAPSATAAAAPTSARVTTPADAEVGVAAEALRAAPAEAGEARHHVVAGPQRRHVGRRRPRRRRRPRGRARSARSSGEARRRRRPRAGRCGRRRSRRCARGPRGRAAGRCRWIRCSPARASRGRRQP